MSEYLIKSETLQDIANALREKTGETGTFKVQDFATEIREIEAGGGDIDGLIDGSLTELTSNATSIRDYANYQNKTVQKASFPNATNIGMQAFGYNVYLKKVNAPNATSIGNNAFYNCLSLDKVIIGTKHASVATLGSSVFNNCSHILGGSNAYNPSGFNDGYIYVPLSLVAEYRVATNWVTYASQIMPWVATVEELANIDGTTYKYACVGEGVDSVEYYFIASTQTWEVSSKNG